MQKPVTFYSEGVKLVGDVYLPEDLKPGERRAGIVLCHGYTGVRNIYLPDNARVLAEAGAPAGVANVINGEPNPMGQAMLAHPGCAKVHFTGSVRVGKNPLASAWVGGRLWVPNIDSNTISVVDPAHNAVSQTIPAGNAPLGALSTGGGVFVSMSNDGAVWRFDTTG